MSDAQATKHELRPVAGAADNAPKPNRIKNWNWYDPPIVISIGLILLIVGYGLVRAPV
jgi:hypothetical protein